MRLAFLCVFIALGAVVAATLAAFVDDALFAAILTLSLGATVAPSLATRTDPHRHLRSHMVLGLRDSRRNRRPHGRDPGAAST